MSLFVNQKSQNLLAQDGEVYYYDQIFGPEKSNEIYQKLLESVPWKNDEAMMFGKHIITKRKVAWYGDINFSYTYSKITKEALQWSDDLLQIRDIVSEKTGSDYNACLLNLYHSGDEGMAWHSDDEKDLVKNASIASLSFGAERKFGFKHKSTKESISLVLEHGSLLEMVGPTQSNWLHRLPPTKKIATPRINLTFRLMKMPCDMNKSQ